MREQSSIRLVGTPPTSQLEELADDDLMRLSRSGRQDAFEALVRRHQQFVLGLTTRFFGEKNAGRDVAQDIFLSLWAERDRYQASGQFRSYLVSVALNRCRHVVRSTRKQGEKLATLAREADEPRDDEKLPLAALVERENAREVRQALTQLPEKCRQVMILRFTNSHSLEEVSALTGMPVGTVKSHLFRGLKRLRHLLRST